MIKRFHALYVGQIELDNIGLNGTPANDRRYPNERLSEAFWPARDVARLLGELGYYCFCSTDRAHNRDRPSIFPWRKEIYGRRPHAGGASSGFASCVELAEKPA